MITNRVSKLTAVGIAALLATTAISSSLALAQTQGPPAQSQNYNTGSASDSGSVPPQGQYAPPPAGYGGSSATYADQEQQADQTYAQQYSQWAARYCVDQQSHNTAAGAVIGGILGAGIGAAVAHNPAAGAAIGGAIGVGTGAVAGASTPNYGCPPGYVVAPGAPAFAYAGPYWGPGVWWAPAWYHPWFWVGGHWVYYPYRYWYWGHRGYWRPGWRWHPWHYHYHRW
jgi:hypothetical protein